VQFEKKHAEWVFQRRPKLHESVVQDNEVWSLPKNIFYIYNIHDEKKGFQWKIMFEIINIYP
jgi:hypothetical protein